MFANDITIFAYFNRYFHFYPNINHDDKRYCIYPNSVMTFLPSSLMTPPLLHINSSNLQVEKCFDELVPGSTFSAIFFNRRTSYQRLIKDQCDLICVCHHFVK